MHRILSIGLRFILSFVIVNIKSDFIHYRHLLTINYKRDTGFLIVKDVA